MIDKQFTEAQVDAIIGNCVANQAMEGQICTEEDVTAMRRIVTGGIALEDEREKGKKMKILRIVAKIAAWIFTGLLTLCGIALKPSFSSIFLFLAAAAVLPLQLWQDMLEKRIPRLRRFRFLVAAVLFFLAVLATP